MGKSRIDFKNIEEAGAIRKEILRVYWSGKMNIIQVIGLPGTGKSWACLRLGELISEDLHKADYKIGVKNVADNLLDLLKFVRGIKKEGEILILEEIGVWLSSKRAMSTDNVDAAKVWDTLRKKRVIVITNNPINKDVDKKLMAMSSMMIQTLSLNKGEGICMLKPMRLQTNPDTAKTYRHRLHQHGFDVHRCWVGRPDDQLCKDYEDSKDSFLDKLYSRLEKKHQEREDKELGKMGEKIGIITQLESKRAAMKLKGMTNREISLIEGKSEETIRLAIKRYHAKISKFQDTEKTDIAIPATH